MPMLDVFLRTNWHLPKLNLTGWRKWELSANPLVPGHHRYNGAKGFLGLVSVRKL